MVKRAEPNNIQEMNVIVSVVVVSMNILAATDLAHAFGQPARGKCVRYCPARLALCSSAVSLTFRVLCTIAPRLFQSFSGKLRIGLVSLAVTIFHPLAGLRAIVALPIILPAPLLVALLAVRRIAPAARELGTGFGLVATQAFFHTTIIAEWNA